MILKDLNFLDNLEVVVFDSIIFERQPPEDFLNLLSMRCPNLTELYFANEFWGPFGLRIPAMNGMTHLSFAQIKPNIRLEFPKQMNELISLSFGPVAIYFELPDMPKLKELNFKPEDISNPKLRQELGQIKAEIAKET